MRNRVSFQSLFQPLGRFRQPQIRGRTAGNRLIRNSSAASSFFLILGRFASPAFGFLAWLLAARLYPQSEVGLASGTVAAMMLCVQIALLGIGAAVIAIYPHYQQRPRDLLNTAVTLVGVVAIVTAATFVLLAANWFEELSIIAVNPIYLIAFLGISGLGALGVLLDHVSIALRRGEQVFLRNILFGVVTVAWISLGSLVSDASAINILMAWVAANLAACSLGFIQLWRSAEHYTYRPRIDTPLVGQLLRVGLPNYGLTLLERMPAQVLPIIVVELLSPAANATWYTAWQMAWVIFVVPWSIAQTLFAEAIRRPDALRKEVIQSIRMALSLSALAAIAAALIAPLLLGFLGESYRIAGVTPLRILVVAALPASFVQMYYAVCRARQRLGEATLMASLSGLFGVGSAATIGLTYDLTGMALAWLITQLLTGAVAYWRLRRVLAGS